MATSAGGGQEDVQVLYEEWKQKQRQLLQELIAATEQLSETGPSCMVEQVIQLYEEHYGAKSRCADKNVLIVLSPSWTSSLEDALLWIGGWRPTTAIQLVYSKSGLQLEAKLSEVFQGITAVRKHDLADLLPGQLSRLDQLHRDIVQEEKKISEKMAKQQERATSGGMVELSQQVSEAMRGEETEGSRRDLEAEEEQVESTLSPKEKGFREVLDKADSLRLRTLKGVIQILSPMQAVHFLIAATELQLRLHEWGMAKDGRQTH